MKTFATALALVSLCALTAILDDPASPPEPGSPAMRPAEQSVARVGGDGTCLDPWSGCMASPTAANTSH